MLVYSVKGKDKLKYQNIIFGRRKGINDKISK